MVRTSVAPPGVSVMRSAMTSVDDVRLEPREQRDALAQRRLEGDLAAHGALGDRGHLLLQADEIGEFVDAFLADHGGVHVGEEQLLAPAGRGLAHDVDRRAAEGVAHVPAASRRAAPSLSMRGGAKGMSAAMPGREPARRDLRAGRNGGGGCR